MDVKMYDAKVKELQNHIPFLQGFINQIKANPTTETSILQKLKKLYKFAEGTKKNRLEIEVITKVEKTVTELKTRWETKALEGWKVEKKADISCTTAVPKSVSETRDRTFLTRNNANPSLTEDPVRFSDDHDKMKKTNRYDEYDRRYRNNDCKQSNQHVEKHERSERQRSRRYERSKSRDRVKRRERSDGLTRSRRSRSRSRGRGRRSRSRSRERGRRSRSRGRRSRSRSRDRRSRSRSHDRRSRSRERRSKSSSRNKSNGKNREKYDRDRRHSYSYKWSNTFSSSSHQYSEKVTVNRRNEPSSTETRSPFPVTALNPPRKRTSQKFNLNLLQQLTPKDPVTESSNQFSFLKTFNQSNIKVDKGLETSINSAGSINIKTGIIKEDQRVTVKDEVSTILLKQILDSVKRHEQKPDVNSEVKLDISEKIQQNDIPEITQSNKDPRLRDPRMRDPRIQPQAKTPCTSKYPLIPAHFSMYPGSPFSQQAIALPKHFPVFSQHSAQLYPNVHSSVPVYSNQRESPATSTMLPPAHFLNPAPTSTNFNGNPKEMYKGWNTERHIPEKPRMNRRYSVYSETPMTYGEYKRKLQSNVSSTLKKKFTETERKPSIVDLSESHLDNVYRSGKFSTPIPTVVTNTFKIPKKTTTEIFKSNEIRAQNSDKAVKSNEIELKTWDEPSNTKEVSANSGQPIIHNSKEIMSCVRGSSDNRDVQDRVSTESTSPSKENKTTDLTEKQTDVIASSTSVVTDDLSSNDNSKIADETVIKSDEWRTLFNLMSEDATLAEIKDMIKMCTKRKATSFLSSDSAKNISVSTDEKKDEVTMPQIIKKKKNELDRLNEDIDAMFIRDGVLSVTGRRSCGRYSATPVAAKNTEVQNETKDGAGIVKQNPPIGNRITRRRLTIFNPEMASKFVTVDRENGTTKEREQETIQVLESTTTKDARIAELVAEMTELESRIERTEAVKVTEEQPTKGVTLSTETRDCKVVLEQMKSTALVHPKEDSEADIQTRQLKVTGKKSLVAKCNIRNDNPDWHSFRKISTCQLCGKGAGLSLVSHFVNMHQNIEVFVSRIAPDVADGLRNPESVHESERVNIPKKTCQQFKQVCYFCNESKCYSRLSWMNHMAKHTGYYQYKCIGCSRKFSEKPKHICKRKGNLEKIAIPNFEKEHLNAYICDLCNYVRFDKNEIVKHLSSQHEGNTTNKFKDTIFLRFPENTKKKRKLEKEHPVVETCETINNFPGFEFESDLPKRQKLTLLDNNVKEISENSSGQVEATKNDELIHQGTIKLMENVAFNASECSSKSNQTIPLAEELSEIFNSIQEDTLYITEKEVPTKIGLLDPLKYDEGIPIIKVAASDGCLEEERSMEVENGSSVPAIEEAPASLQSTILVPSRKNADVFTEKCESDDDWESCSDDTDSVHESITTQCQLDANKNVGISNTITRLQQSISLEAATTKLNESGYPTEQKKKLSLSYERIVREALGADDEEQRAGFCDGNRTYPNSIHPFTSNTANQPASYLRSRNVGNSSLVPDLSLYTVGRNYQPTIFLTRIDNIGYNTRISDGVQFSFCCLLCGYETLYLSDLELHIKYHPVNWYGFCYSCNTQIHNCQAELMMEFNHMEAHFSKNNHKINYVDNTEKPPVIKFKMLPGDKLSRSNIEVTKSKQLGSNPRTTIRSMPLVTSALKIANVTSLTSTINVVNSPNNSKMVPFPVNQWEL